MDKNKLPNGKKIEIKSVFPNARTHIKNSSIEEAQKIKDEYLKTLNSDKHVLEDEKTVYILLSTERDEDREIENLKVKLKNETNAERRTKIEMELKLSEGMRARRDLKFINAQKRQRIDDQINKKRNKTKCGRSGLEAQIEKDKELKKNINSSYYVKNRK